MTSFWTLRTSSPMPIRRPSPTRVSEIDASKHSIFCVFLNKNEHLRVGGQLNRAMYEATDILNLCHLKAMERGSSSIDAGCFNPVLGIPPMLTKSGPTSRCSTRGLIKERTAALNVINVRHHRSKVHPSCHGNLAVSYQGSSTGRLWLGTRSKKTQEQVCPRFMQTGKKVKNNIMVVAVVGVGGIRKTTLAQKVFNDKAIPGECQPKPQRG